MDAGWLGGIFLLVLLIILGVQLGLWALMWWKVFTKAGWPGVASIVPYWNLWVLFEIGGKPGAYIFFALIPCVGPILLLVFMIMAYVEIAKRFGQSGAYAVGLIFLPIIFFPILGFGSAEYDDGAGRRGRRRRFDDEYDEYEEEDRPRRRRREVDDEDRPRRRRDQADDDRSRRPPRRDDY